MPKYIIRIFAEGEDLNDAFDKVKDALEFSEVETSMDGYGPAPEDCWADHESIEDWITAVKNGDTRIGFWEWLNTQSNNETEEEEKQNG